MILTKKLRHARRWITGMIAACLALTSISSGLVISALSAEEDGWYVNGQWAGDEENGYQVASVNIDPDYDGDFSIQYKVDGQPICFNDKVNYELGIGTSPASGSPDGAPRLTITSDYLSKTCDTLVVRAKDADFSGCDGATVVYYPFSIYKAGFSNPKPAEAIVSKLCLKIVVGRQPEVSDKDGLYLNGQYVEKNGTYTINVDPGSVAKIDVSYILNGANAVFGDRDVDGSYCGLSFGPMRDEDGTQRVAGITSNYAYEDAVQSRQFEVSFIGKDAGKTYNLRVRVSNKDETINTLFYVRFVVSENPTGVTSTVNLDNFQGMDHAQISIFGATGISTEELLAGAEAWPGSIVTVEYTPEEGYWRDPQALKIVDRDGQPVDIINVNLNKEYRLNLQFRMPYGGAFIYENVQPNGEVTFLPMEHGSITLNSATAGSVASFTITPEEGYILDTLTARNSQGEVVKDYVYASDIVMSNGLVGSSVPFDGRNMTVEATFKKKVLQFNIVDTQNGSVTVDAEWYDKGVNDYAGVAVQGAPFGETVTFTVTPDTGYMLTPGSVQVNGGAVALTENGNGTYTFTMPGEAAIISAAFEKINYAVTLGTFENGAVTASAATAQMGDTVTLTVTPDTGYQLTADSLKVNGGDVALTDNGDGTYTFTMPVGAVEITAEFEQVPEEPPTDPEEPSTDPEEPSSDAPATDGTDGDEPTSSSGQDNVDTGDAALAAAAGAALLSAGAVLVLTKKKRRS